MPLSASDADESDEFVSGDVKAVKNATLLYKQIYFIASLAIIIASIILNVWVLPEHLWSILVAAGLVYVYLLINRLFITYYNLAYVTVTISFGAAVISFLVQWIFHIDRLAIYYVIPVISIVSTIVLGIVVLIKPRRAKEYLLDYLAIGLMGIAPWLVSRLVYHSVGLPSAISACVGAAMLLFLLCVSLRDVAKDLDKYFHS